MFRLVRRTLPLALLLILISQSSAQAAIKTVSMTHPIFTPETVKPAPGETVRWTNDEPPGALTVHTSTGNSPLALWDSGSMMPGDSFDFVFIAGGKYPYHCTFHSRSGMKGTVSVKIKAQPPSGPVGTVFTVTVASVDAPSGFVYDIQKKNPGGSFQNWMLGVTSKSVQFNSSGQPTGTYSFRSRLHRTSDNATSGFSPVKSITVT
jgi:plastocyanin